jgi:uncharacterized protein with HEPN domain
VKDDGLYLHHMLERCRRIARFISPGKETITAAEEIQDAVIRNIEVIAKRRNGFHQSHVANSLISIGNGSAECATF